MWDKLLPKEYGFFDLFNRHAAAALDAARVLVATLDEWPAAEGRVQRIIELEHECDNLTHMTVDLIHRTFITPLDRDEIVRLISTQDDVVDQIEAAAQRLILFDIRVIPTRLKELSRVLLRSMEQVVVIVGMTKNLKDQARLREILKEIHSLENEGDGLHRAGLAELFREYAGDPLTVIKLKEVYETIEDAVDQCEDIANIVEGISLEHA